MEPEAATPPESPFDPAAWLEERVPIELYWDGDKYKGEEFFQVNGENCLIERGKVVYVKRKIALDLEQSAREDANTRRMIVKLINQSAADLKRA
jgi:hypothetical protein